MDAVDRSSKAVTPPPTRVSMTTMSQGVRVKAPVALVGHVRACLAGDFA